MKKTPARKGPKPWRWKRRHAHESCSTGFCRHCGWINAPFTVRPPKKK